MSRQIVLSYSFCALIVFDWYLGMAGQVDDVTVQYVFYHDLTYSIKRKISFHSDQMVSKERLHLPNVCGKGNLRRP